MSGVGGGDVVGPDAAVADAEKTDRVADSDAIATETITAGPSAVGLRG